MEEGGQFRGCILRRGDTEACDPRKEDTQRARPSCSPPEFLSQFRLQGNLPIGIVSGVVLGNSAIGWSFELDHPPPVGNEDTVTDGKWSSRSS